MGLPEAVGSAPTWRTSSKNTTARSASMVMSDSADDSCVKRSPFGPLRNFTYSLGEPLASK